MKVLYSIFTLFFLLLLEMKQMEARRSPEECWRHVMGEQPIPEAIAGLLMSNPQEGKDSVHRRYGGGSSQKPNWERWINRDFDTRSVAIIYHKHDHSRMIPHHHHHQVDHHGDEHAS